MRVEHTSPTDINVTHTGLVAHRRDLPQVIVNRVTGIVLAGNARSTTRIVFSLLVGHAIIAAGTLTCTGICDRNVVFMAKVPDRAVNVSERHGEVGD